jgi:glyoxylase-like metal-dependent hydrolase (beta-lactamase superfamily II)
MELKTLEIGMFQVNCYVLIDEETKTFSIIDAPGIHPFFDQLVSDGYKFEKVLLTHGHVDHVAGLKQILLKYKPVVAVHRDDLNMYLKAGEGQFATMLNAENPPEPDFYLTDGTEVKAGSIGLKVIHTPGHTRGGVCFFDYKNNLLFTGDTLFARSIGRTDLKGGDYNTLINSIKSKLFVIKDETKVFPGHGAFTTIGEEKTSNPFLT